MFDEYHLFDGAKIITNKIPGKKSKELLSAQDKLESRNRSYPRGIPIAYESAKGAIIKDVDGNIFVDFFSGCGVLNLGYNNQDILKEINESPNFIMHALDFPTKIKIDFMRELIASTPKHLQGKYKISFGGPTGSDAVEAAIKLARINTGRHTIISFQGSYHGMTMGAMSVTSKLSHREKVNPLIPGVHFMPYSSCYRCAMSRKPKSCNFECVNFLKNALENPHSGIDKPAAIIIEPIQGEGGTYIPKNGWLEKVVEIASANGIIVIFDEVQTGFYRTGKLFSFEHTKAIPDIITMSKGVGGIGTPLSLILLRKELDKWEPGTHIGTFRGNQLGMAAGLLALKFIKKMKIEAYVLKMERLFLNQLRVIQKSSKFIGEVRGRGMMFGIEYVKDIVTKEPFPEMAKKIRKLCYENGLLVEIGGYYNNVVRFLPPLIISEKIALNGLGIFRKANDLAGNRKH
ncbi:MAG: aspartate aminotransferase family protein [Patescibacteria group bacterium]|jgi:diaminobutyrate-2-oxoglutarate transaminase